MAATPPAYPTILTDKDWQKQKGKIAKLAGETGVGAQMNKCEAAYKKVDFSEFSAKLNCTRDKGVFTPGQVQVALRNAIQGLDRATNPVRTELHKLDSLATKAAGDFKKNKLIPASSTKHAELIAKTAGEFAVALKAGSVYSKALEADYAEEASRLQKNVDMATKSLASNLVAIKKYAVEVLKDPTPENYKGGATDGFYQKVRGTAAALKALSDIPAYKAQEPAWKTVSSAGALPKTNEEVTKTVKAVVKLVGVLESIQV